MSSKLTDLEKKIFDELFKIDPKIADMYYGAISVLDRDNNQQSVVDESSLDKIESRKLNPERLSQSAHSIRETLRNLFNKIEVPQQEAAFRERIRKFSDPLQALPPYLHGLFDELVRLHKWFTGVSHHASTDDNEFNENLGKLNSVLYRILAPHFVSLKEIDELLEITDPTDEHMKKLKPLISKNYESYSYFFRNANHKWLPLLVKNGFFVDPPPPKREGDFIQFPSWPESSYLARIAKDDPKSVYVLIEKCKIPTNVEEQNSRVLEDFVRAGINMPCEDAAKMSELIVKNRWQDQRSLSLLAHEMANLMNKLIECGDTTSATKLGELLLDVDVVAIPLTGV